MSEIKLVATTRTEFGKGAARRLRRADQVPAVLYGHGSDPLHVALPGHQTMLAVKQANALFAIDVRGPRAEKRTAEYIYERAVAVKHTQTAASQSEIFDREAPWCHGVRCVRCHSHAPRD